MSVLATEIAGRISQIQQNLATLNGTTPTVAATADDFDSTLEGVADAADGTGASLGTRTADPGTGDADTGSSSLSGSTVVADARRYLGVRYQWGGTDPTTGLDCSGLVQRVYADLGVTLPRVSRDQAKEGTAVSSLARAKPGDLVAFGSPVDHIGIYIGDGKMIVAPHTGTVVQVEKVYTTPTAIRRIIPDGTGEPTTGGGVRARAGADLGSGSARYSELFAAAGRKYGLSPTLLSAVAKVESGYNPDARSPAGAEGLMQLMPGTARGLGVDPWKPAEAIDGAARMLAADRKRFGSTALALAAYNAGPTAVQRYGGVPPYAETQAYVQAVLALAGKDAA